jgi:hypothetical protein
MINRNKDTWRLERISGSGRLNEVWEVICQGDEAKVKQCFSKHANNIGEATLRLYRNGSLYGTKNKAGSHLCGSELPLRGVNREDDN